MALRLFIILLLVSTFLYDGGHVVGIDAEDPQNSLNNVEASSITVAGDFSDTSNTILQRKQRDQINRYLIPLPTPPTPAPAALPTLSSCPRISPSANIKSSTSEPSSPTTDKLSVESVDATPSILTLGATCGKTTHQPSLSTSAQPPSVQLPTSDLSLSTSHLETSQSCSASQRPAEDSLLSATNGLTTSVEDTLPSTVLSHRQTSYTESPTLSSPILASQSPAHTDTAPTVSADNATPSSSVLSPEPTPLETDSSSSLAPSEVIEADVDPNDHVPLDVTEELASVGTPIPDSPLASSEHGDDNTSMEAPTTPPSEDDLPSFEEWKKKKEQDKAKNCQDEGTQPAPEPPSNGNGNGKSAKLVNSQQNFANVDCGAKVVSANPEAQNWKAIIDTNRDVYLLNPCSANIWFIVELCDEVLLQTVEMANFEMFSSSPQNFTVFTSNRFPTREWKARGKFQANDTREVQVFELPEHVYAKYVKIEIVSHHGVQHYCPISLFRVKATSMVQEYEIAEDIDKDSLQDDMNDSAQFSETEVDLVKRAKYAVMNILSSLLPGGSNETSEPEQAEVKQGETSDKDPSSTDMLANETDSSMPDDQAHTNTSAMVPDNGGNQTIMNASNATVEGNDQDLVVELNATSATESIDTSAAQPAEDIVGSQRDDVDASDPPGPKTPASATADSPATDSLSMNSPVEPVVMQDIPATLATVEPVVVAAEHGNPASATATDKGETAAISESPVDQSTPPSDDVPHDEQSDPEIATSDSAVADVPALSESLSTPSSDSDDAHVSLVNDTKQDSPTNTTDGSIGLSTANSSSPVTPNAPNDSRHSDESAQNSQTSSHKESVFMRLNNRIKSLDSKLDANITLIQHYLDELSASFNRFRKNMTELQRSNEIRLQRLNESLAVVHEQLIKAIVDNRNIEAGVANLTGTVLLLVNELVHLNDQTRSYMSTFIAVLVTIMAVFMLVFVIFVGNRLSATCVQQQKTLDALQQALQDSQFHLAGDALASSSGNKKSAQSTGDRNSQAIQRTLSDTNTHSPSSSASVYRTVASSPDLTLLDGGAAADEGDWISVGKHRPAALSRSSYGGPVSRQGNGSSSTPPLYGGVGVSRKQGRKFHR